MPDKNKYEFALNEINDLEKGVYSFVQKVEEAMIEKKELLEKINNLEKENEALKQKLNEIETKILNPAALDEFGGELDDSDTESLKEKISELISKIDYHLRS